MTSSNARFPVQQGHQSRHFISLVCTLREAKQGDPEVGLLEPLYKVLDEGGLEPHIRSLTLDFQNDSFIPSSKLHLYCISVLCST